MEQRITRIKKLGADVCVCPVNFDETVYVALEEVKVKIECNCEAKFIQDTTLDNYIVRPELVN